MFTPGSSLDTTKTEESTWTCDDNYNIIKGSRLIDHIYYASDRAKEAIIASCFYHCDHWLGSCAEFAFIQTPGTSPSCSFYEQQGQLDIDEKAKQGCVCYRIYKKDILNPRKCGGYMKMKCPRGFRCSIFPPRRRLGFMFGNCIQNVPDQKPVIEDDRKKERPIFIWVCDRRYNEVSGVVGVTGRSRWFPADMKQKLVIERCKNYCDFAFRCSEFVYQKYYGAQKCTYYSGGGDFVKKKRHAAGAVCYRFNSALLNDTRPRKCGGANYLRCPHGFECNVSLRKSLGNVYGNCFVQIGGKSNLDFKAANSVETDPNLGMKAANHAGTNPIFIMSFIIVVVICVLVFSYWKGSKISSNESYILLED